MSECVLRIRVTPRSGREAVGEMRDGEIQVKLTAPPVDGAANKALLKLLSKRLGVPRSSLEITGGETARHKRVRVEGLSEDAALERLLGSGA